MYFPETSGQRWAFLGPMIGSLVRPLGGWVSDKLGGGLVTFWTTIVKIIAALGIIYFLPTETRSFVGFFVTFLAVFLMSGIANASIFKMVPFIFPAGQAGAVLGFSSAIASFGAFAIPEMFSWSLETYDTVIVALWWIVGFYVFCTALMWWHYVRKDAPIKV
jgi:NNP family nitrate/nitrite transporter-like MFS transporter